MYLQIWDKTRSNDIYIVEDSNTKDTKAIEIMDHLRLSYTEIKRSYGPIELVIFRKTN